MLSVTGKKEIFTKPVDKKKKKKIAKISQELVLYCSFVLFCLFPCLKKNKGLQFFGLFSPIYATAALGKVQVAH